jgi:hypothetical protein
VRFKTRRFATSVAVGGSHVGRTRRAAPGHLARDSLRIQPSLAVLSRSPSVTQAERGKWMKPPLKSLYGEADERCPGASCECRRERVVLHVLI